MYEHTIVVASWRDIPAVRSDCMAKLAPGIWSHQRLGILFVCKDEANTEAGIAAIMGEATQRIEAASRREAGLERTTLQAELVQ